MDLELQFDHKIYFRLGLNEQKEQTLDLQIIIFDRFTDLFQPKNTWKIPQTVKYHFYQ